MPQALASASYNQLIKTLRREITTAVERTERFVNHQRVAVNWKVGRHLHEYLTIHIRDGLSENQLILPIARDLGINRRMLQLTVQFYRTYPELPRESFLTWSHYRNLVKITNAEERARWEQRIIRERMSHKTFDNSAFLDDGTLQVKDARKTGRLPVQRGELYVYRLLDVPDIHDEEKEGLVDCGFQVSIRRPASDLKKWISGTPVRSKKTGGGFTIVAAHTKKDVLYTYQAWIERVVDGDTIIARIDLGFRMMIRQYLRLKGINAPELKTLPGKKTREYMETILGTADFVVIKTYRSDKYDRYLTDIFFLPGEPDPQEVASRGRLLNQELLDAGLAELW